MNNFALNKKHRFTGVFDTGAGGLNVLKECKRLMPYENYLYFADTFSAPYGNRDENEIQRLTMAAVKKMEGYGLKALLLACNTATSAAAETLRKTFFYPIIGMEPALKPATAAAAEGKNILLLCTPATARQEKLKSLIKTLPRQNIIIAPQESLASDIENNIENLSALKDRLIDMLSPYQAKNIGAVVLGCTHYIFIKAMINEILGGIPVFDGADGTVKNLENTLLHADLTTQKTEKGQLLIVTTAPPKISYWKLC